jgi:hypothetical protein
MWDEHGKPTIIWATASTLEVVVESADFLRHDQHLKSTGWKQVPIAANMIEHGEARSDGTIYTSI